MTVAYDKVLDTLLDGSLRPGMNLSIEVWPESWGFPRHPIREALVNLEHTGLVTRTALRGYRVAPPFSAEQIGQLMDARTIVELGALDQALDGGRTRSGPPPGARTAPAGHRRHRRRRGVVDRQRADRELPPICRLGLGLSRRDDATGRQPFRPPARRVVGAHVHRLRQTIDVGLTDSHETSVEHGRILVALETSAPDHAVKEALGDHLEAVRTRSIADSKLARRVTTDRGPGGAFERRPSAPADGPCPPPRDRIRKVLLMTAARPTGPSPAFAGAVPLERVLADQPRCCTSTSRWTQVRAGRRLVVLDDDPTGTQSIADLPVLTSWSVADLQWALRQPTTAFFILTNTRSLSEADAVERNRQIVDALRPGGGSGGRAVRDPQPERLHPARLLPARDRRAGRGARRTGAPPSTGW